MIIIDKFIVCIWLRKEQSSTQTGKLLNLLLPAQRNSNKKMKTTQFPNSIVYN